MKYSAKALAKRRGMSKAIELGTTGFTSTMAGHIVLLNLMKRFRCVTTQLHPEQVEAGFDDSWPNMWNQLSLKALGHHVPMMDATTREMWVMARFLLAAIEDNQYRYAWYPLRWEEMAKLLRGELRPEPRAGVKPPEHDHTNYPEAALTFVSTSMKMTPDAVLASLGLTRPLSDCDETTIMGMLK